MKKQSITLKKLALKKIEISKLNLKMITGGSLLGTASGNIKTCNGACNVTNGTTSIPRDV